MRVLITGVSGFCGGHLARYLSAMKGLELFGLARDVSKAKPVLAEFGKLHFFSCDLTDPKKTLKTLLLVKPDYIFHLAGQSFVPDSIRFPASTLSSNILSQLNLLEAAKALKRFPLIHVAGSAVVYGGVSKAELPIKENASFRPATAYAVSKAAQELLSYQYFTTFGLKIIQTRAFSHVGPGQDARFALSHFAKEIALILSGRKRPVIQVGNLSIAKDFTDVRDVAKAYWLCLKKGKPGEVYNVCSGKAFKVGDILGRLVAISGKKIRIKIDRNRLRSYEAPVLLGNSDKFRKISGWKPEIPIDQTLNDLLKDWMNRINDDSTQEKISS